LLSASSTDVIRQIMASCRTGVRRIRGLLPTHATVADKTGTIGGVANDVGLITLPDGLGDIVISAYIKKSAAPFEERERAIAEIARTVYDYFLFTADASLS